MSFNQTQTTKSILSNVDAVELAHRLRDLALSAGPILEQAIYQTATPSSIDALEELIGTATHLLERRFLSAEELATRKYMRDTIQSFKGNRK